MYDFKNPALRLHPGTNAQGSIQWQSPSNIAIVKYWGKYGDQLPRNPSISLTLSSARTITKLDYRPKETDSPGISLDFTFEGNPRPAFSQKVQQFLERMTPYFPFIEQLHIRIDTRNTFPHSAGIASSASSMSALALLLCDVEQQHFHTLSDSGLFFKKASFIARLGSGSACRSVYPHAALWGHSEAHPESSDLYAIPFSDHCHPVFHSFHDDILIVSNKEKSVSSRAGHQLMENNPYAENRYAQASRHTRQLSDALQTGDLALFGEIAESEALTLHALMMASNPPFILLQPHTLALISHIQQYRTESGLPIYFTLDAGPNIHLLYPDTIAAQVQPFIQGTLRPFCENGMIISDQTGEGPNRIE